MKICCDLFLQVKHEVSQNWIRVMVEGLEAPSYGAQVWCTSMVVRLNLKWASRQLINSLHHPSRKWVPLLVQGSSKRRGFGSASHIQCLRYSMSLAATAPMAPITFLYHKIIIRTQLYLSLSLSSHQYFHLYILSYHQQSAAVI